MNNLAIWMMEANDLASAGGLLREALELRKKALGPAHPDLAGTMTLLAGALIETHRYDEARALAADAKTIYLKALGAKHWRTASAANAEGAALAGLKQFEQAEPLLVQSNAMLHADTGALNYYVKSSDRWLAGLYQTTGRPHKAAKHLAQAGRVTDH